MYNPYTTTNKLHDLLNDHNSNNQNYTGHLIKARFTNDHRKRFFEFNSELRENILNTNSNDCQIKIPEALENVKTIDMVYFAMPNGIYNIENKSFSFNQGGIQTFNIPDGNYSATALLAYLKTQCDTLSGNVWTFTVDTITGKLTISSTVAFTVDFTITNSLFAILGFPYAVTTLGLATTGTRIINLIPIQSLFIYIEEYESLGFNQQMSFNFCVPVDSQFGDLIVYQKNNSIEQINFFNKTPKKFNAFNIRLVDYLGRVINLNGAPWTMILAVTYYD